MQNRAVLERLVNGGFDDGNVSGADGIRAALSRLPIGIQNPSKSGTGVLAGLILGWPPRAAPRLFSRFHSAFSHLVPDGECKSCLKKAMQMGHHITYQP